MNKRLRGRKAVEQRKRWRPQYRALYKDPRWAGIRQFVFNRDNYTCRWPGCGKLLIGKGQAHNAPVAHHIKDHKGDLALFLDPENIMSICKEDHDRDAQKAEHRGYIVGHDASGRSIDPAHPWNR